MKFRAIGYRAILSVLLGIVLFLINSYINHQRKLGAEERLLIPMGKMVMVDGHKMSLYMKGRGENTLVFMSGGGTCSPILDFKSL